MRDGPYYSRPSHQAARRIEEALDEADGWDVVEELLGETDCPHGCYVEPDGQCPHGFKSAGLTAGLI